MNQQKISKCVKMAMISKGIDSPGLADALGVTETTVANYRAGGMKAGVCTGPWGVRKVPARAAPERASRW